MTIDLQTRKQIQTKGYTPVTELEGAGQDPQGSPGLLLRTRLPPLTVAGEKLKELNGGMISPQILLHP